MLCQFYFSDTKTFKNRPVLVLKNNLPFDDFVAVAISSKIEKLYFDEVVISQSDFLSGGLPLSSKVMMRKTFVASQTAIQKRYGTLSMQSYKKLHRHFCSYFDCVENN